MCVLQQNPGKKPVGLHATLCPKLLVNNVIHAGFLDKTVAGTLPKSSEFSSKMQRRQNYKA
jgi:hypothetical protein